MIVWVSWLVFLHRQTALLDGSDLRAVHQNTHFTISRNIYIFFIHCHLYAINGKVKKMSTSRCLLELVKYDLEKMITIIFLR